MAVFDPAAREALCEFFRQRQIDIRAAETPGRAASWLDRQAGEPDPILWIAEVGDQGITFPLLRQVSERGPVVALAEPDPELFFQAAKAGADAVLPLPLHDYAQRLDGFCDRIREGEPVRGETAPSAASPSGGFALSEEMAEVRELMEKVAPTSATVLIRGESGVGKELAARLIHARSPRKDRPFVKVNCAAIPNELLESELFGYDAGAFTGAVKAKPGKFELADGGTIFLDEIGELHPVLQAKLLHVLQDGEFARLGAKHDTAVDVRVICATNKLLEVLVANGQFREDLYYRINVITVSLPPLRSRAREIPGLVASFLERYCGLYGKPLVPPTAEAMRALMAYSWPGNIRELENLCKRYVIVGSMEQILRELEQRQERRQPVLLEKPKAEAVPDSCVGSDAAGRPPSLLEIGRAAAWAAERIAIARALEETRWNRREAARRLGVSYKALLNKIAQMKWEAGSQDREAVYR